MSLELKNSIWIDFIPHNVTDLARTRRGGLVGSPVLVTRVVATTTRADQARGDPQQTPADPVEELAALLNRL